ncbi:hypothetical protein [Flavihumibacter sp. CACIAM 22H1]|uniref:hypothetical protein n=1 Tax=Flavihumibacter sp. CACIAM 22H1 TaxID=1812911 RepID=UPI0025B9405F|nr:hypothetical protein [Flavihumibacter sp. CACIAM 22H1]
MKKLAAILFMSMLLYNVVGYRAVFSWLEQRSYQTLNQELDNLGYDEAELITIKVPINELPYFTNSPIFERTNGTISVQGITYQYVERRIYNDSLEMRCISNPLATNLTNARDLFFQLVNDLQHGNPTGKQAPAKPVLALKNTITDFTLFEEVIGFEPVFSTLSTSYNLFQLKDCKHTKATQEQPPDAVVTDCIS